MDEEVDRLCPDKVKDGGELWAAIGKMVNINGILKYCQRKTVATSGNSHLTFCHSAKAATVKFFKRHLRRSRVLLLVSLVLI